MVTRIFGDKNCFAIECCVKGKGKYIMGGVRLWIKGQCIGRIDEEVMLQSVCNFMKSKLSRLRPYQGCCEIHDDKELYRIIKIEGFDGNGEYFFCPAESFDEWSIIVCKCFQKYIRFVWKYSCLSENIIGENDVGEVYAESILISYYVDVLDEFDAYIRKL